MQSNQRNGTCTQLHLKGFTNQGVSGMRKELSNRLFCSLAQDYNSIKYASINPSPTQLPYTHPRSLVSPSRYLILTSYPSPCLEPSNCDSFVCESKFQKQTDWNSSLICFWQLFLLWCRGWVLSARKDSSTSLVLRCSLSLEFLGKTEQSDVVVNVQITRRIQSKRW